MSFFLLLPCGVRPVAAEPFAYVPNSNDDNVSVIATATNTVVATVTVGDDPQAFGFFIQPTFLLAVPTLSGWAAIGLALCLVALGGWRLSRRRPAGSHRLA